MVQFELNITNTCPAKCYDCIMSYYKPPENIIVDVIKEAIKHEDIFVWLTGGEPMLRPDLVEEILKAGATSQIVTMGLYHEDKILEFIHKYPNVQKINVSILGTPEFEKEFRKIDKDFKRNWIYKVPDKINIVFVVYKDEITSGRAFNNIDYVFENYHQFPICVLYDRCDRFEDGQLEKFGLYLKEKSEQYKTRTMILPVRTVWPTVFVSGENLNFYHGKCPTIIHSSDALKDMGGFIDSVIGSHRLNSYESMIKCDVYKKYKGCGGPACRYGYIEECRDFWQQFIEPAKAIGKEAWL